MSGSRRSRSRRSGRVLSESHEGVGEQHGSPAGGLGGPPQQRREPHRVPGLEGLLVPPAYACMASDVPLPEA
jgi:hypothetical protein